MAEVTDFQRQRGLEKMAEVYGLEMGPEDVVGDYMAFLVDHLFGDLWTREQLGIKDRRLLTMGVLAALGADDLLRVQFDRALARGELDVQEVREVVLHLTHYVGWPRSTGMHRVAEDVIEQRTGAEGAEREQS